MRNENDQVQRLHQLDSLSGRDCGSGLASWEPQIIHLAPSLDQPMTFSKPFLFLGLSFLICERGAREQGAFQHVGRW